MQILIVLIILDVNSVLSCFETLTFFLFFFSGNCPFPRLIIEADDQAPIYYNKKQINNRMTNQI